jgi:hypothetical protein
VKASRIVEAVDIGGDLLSRLGARGPHAVVEIRFERSEKLSTTALS